jgi:hypothetical protein
MWTLSYPNRGTLPGCNLTFGTQGTGIVNLEEPDIAYGDPIVGDQDLPGEDGIRMGLDYVSPLTVTFNLGVLSSARPSNLNQDSYQQAHLGMVSKLRNAWRADSIRGVSSTMATLRVHKAGRERFLYGRPRRFAPAHSRLYRQGYTPVVADFKAVDDRWYDATQQTAVIETRYVLQRDPGHWWIFKPVKVQAAGTLNIGGDMSTWPFFRIEGPASNIRIVIGSSAGTQIDFTLNYTIGAGHHVWVDPRPWCRYAVTETGASVAHLLTPGSSPLSKMFLPPAVYSFNAYYNSPVANQWGPITCYWSNAYGWM